MKIAAKQIVVALSGGVDSAVAAALLLEQGWQVRGVHLRLGERPAADLAAIERLGEFLGIECLQLDFRREFNDRVIDYFTALYSAGKTPNPCVRCNEQIKFGLLLEVIRSWGYQYLATGHYARVEAGADGRLALWRGLDPRKDQSYFLHRLNYDSLAAVVFPLGRWTKSQVAARSLTLGLQPYLPPRESQEICFINGDYVDFIQSRRGVGLNQPGPIINRQGRVLGTHRGLWHYTVGQRRGLGVPAPEPYYVLSLNPEANEVVVGGRTELLSTVIEVEDLNWLMPPPQEPLRAEVRIRYRHPGVGCGIFPAGAHRVQVTLDRPQAAVTPGQAAVFYQGDRVLGGGWIIRGTMP